MKKRKINKEINKYVKVIKHLKRTNKISDKEFNDYNDALNIFKKYNDYEGVKDLFKPFTNGQTSYRGIKQSLKKLNDTTINEIRINNFFNENEYLFNDISGSSNNFARAKAKWAIKHLFNNDVSSYNDYIKEHKNRK